MMILLSIVLLLMRQFKVCLSVQTFVWAKNQIKIDLFSQNLYVYEVNNLSSYTENCDHILDAF